MTTPTQTKPVDVLRVLDSLVAVLNGDAGKIELDGDTARNVRTAVADLIDSGEKLRDGMIHPDDHKRQNIYTFQRADVDGFLSALRRVRGEV